MIGAYKRELPRIILYPLNQKARNNYFPNDEFYRKNNTGPSIIGFRTAGYNKNVFIRDLQPNDIILFIASDGTRCTRAEFMNRIKAGELSLYKFAAYRTKEKIVEKGKSGLGVDAEYWPDEIKSTK